jgi:hypothetical protein
VKPATTSNPGARGYSARLSDGEICRALGSDPRDGEGGARRGAGANLERRSSGAARTPRWHHTSLNRTTRPSSLLRRARRAARSEQPPTRPSDRMCCGMNTCDFPTRRARDCACDASGTCCRRRGRTCTQRRLCSPMWSNRVLSERQAGASTGTQASRRRRARAEVGSRTCDRRLPCLNRVMRRGSACHVATPLPAD